MSLKHHGHSTEDIKPEQAKAILTIMFYVKNYTQASERTEVNRQVHDRANA